MTLPPGHVVVTDSPRYFNITPMRNGVTKRVDMANDMPATFDELEALIARDCDLNLIRGDGIDPTKFHERRGKLVGIGSSAAGLQVNLYDMTAEDYDISLLVRHTLTRKFDHTHPAWYPGDNHIFGVRYPMTDVHISRSKEEQRTFYENIKALARTDVIKEGEEDKTEYFTSEFQTKISKAESAELKMLEGKAKLTSAGMTGVLGHGRDDYVELGPVMTHLEEMLTTDAGDRCPLLDGMPAPLSGVGHAKTPKPP